MSQEREARWVQGLSHFSLILRHSIGSVTRVITVTVILGLSDYLCIQSAANQGGGA